jgi:hypothetical protein
LRGGLEGQRREGRGRQERFEEGLEGLGTVGGQEGAFWFAAETKGLPFF